MICGQRFSQRILTLVCPSIELCQQAQSGIQTVTSLSVTVGAAVDTHFEVEGSFITGCHRCTQLVTSKCLAVSSLSCYKCFPLKQQQWVDQKVLQNLRNTPPQVLLSSRRRVQSRGGLLRHCLGFFLTELSFQLKTQSGCHLDDCGM